MFRRLLTVGLLAALVWTARAEAKPPDLPLVDRGVLAEEASFVPLESSDPSPPNPFPPAASLAAPPKDVPLFVQLRPSTRRMMASCLLFGVHPLLTLAPTGEYLDFDEDDAPLLPAVFTPPAAGEAQTGTLLIGVGVNSDAGLTGSVEMTPATAGGLGCSRMLKACQRVFPHVMGPAKAQAEKPEGGKGVFLVQFVDSGTAPAPIAPEVIHEAPKVIGPDDDAPSVCPWVREHQAGVGSRIVSFDADLSRDVLQNLELLRQAHALLDHARELGRSGRVVEALAFLDVAHGLCPGNRLDDAVQQAAAELFAPIYCGSPAGGYGAEEQAEPPAEKTNAAPAEDSCPPQGGKGQSRGSVEREGEVQRKLTEPMTVNFQDAPLHEVIDDLRIGQNLNIYVDKAALDAEEISLDHPVTIKVENVAFKAILHLILREAHLTYLIKDEVLQITTERAAHDHATAPNVLGYGVFRPAADLLEATPRCGQGRDVEALMRQCHEAMEAGQTRKAVALARQAFDCDPEQAAADPLVYKMQLAGDDVPPPVRMTPCLPPVDPGTPAALDQLYRESFRSQPVGGAEEQEPPAASGVAKPLQLTGELESVGHGKDGGAGVPYQEAWAGFLEAMRQCNGGGFEAGLSVNGFRMFGQFRQGGAVWHVQYHDGGLSVWAAPNGGADAGPAETKTPVDDSGD